MQKENPNPSQNEAFSILQAETFFFKLELKQKNLNITYYNLASCICTPILQQYHLHIHIYLQLYKN